MLKATHLSRVFDEEHVALHDVSLAVDAGEILVVLGGSGCGKSTLLRILAGLDRPTRGEATLDGEPITEPNPKLGLVFQEPRLMPWLKVRDNVAFGLRDLPADVRRRRVEAALERVGIAHRAEAFPSQLSGGQAQRAAIARALVTEPSVLLFDEPFSAVDALTRSQLQAHVLELWEADRRTMVVVTHDIEEALIMGDRILVMRPHPGQVHCELAVDLPRPRDIDDPAFIALRRRTLALLREASGALDDAA
ncbi:MAG: ABC transporter ATP-binding protein [Alphaproteobacteria bacterium]